MNLSRGLRAAMLAAAVLSTLLALQYAAAQQRGGDKPAPPSIDQATGQKLNEAIEFLNQERYGDAKQVLATLSPDGLSPYEESRVEQILASIEYNEGNYAAARGHLQAALDSGGLNEQELSQVRYQVAQMFMAEEKWADGAAAMEAWIRATPEPNSAAYYLLAVAYYQQEEYEAALAPATKAVELTEKPHENWLQLQMALLLQKEDYRAAVPVLQRLINDVAPEKKVYWQQLSSVYAQLEDYPNALALLQLAHHGDLLTEDADIRRLADMLVMQNAPARAGGLLVDALERKLVTGDVKLYEKLANSWIAAREYKASLPWLARAASMAGDGNLYIRLAEVNMQLEDWPAVSAALQAAIDKGGLRDEGNAHLLMGIALYNQGSYAAARDWLRRAAASQDHERTARGYLQIIDSVDG